MDEEKLVKLIHSGDPEAFIHIISRYNKLLWIIARGILQTVGTSEDIEECISDVYVSLWRNPKAYDSRKGSLKTFLATIAKHKALDKYRQLAKSKITELDESFSLSDDDMFKYVATQELYNELYDAIHELGEPDKEVLIRRYFLDEKPSAIANNTSLPVKEIENRLYQSKLKLRKLLRDKEATEYGS